MPRIAVTDGAGVLLYHGYVTPAPGEISRAVAEDFRLEPGLWKWDGGAWIPRARPRPPKDIDRDDLAAHLADMAADGTLPPKLQALAAKLARVV